MGRRFLVLFGGAMLGGSALAAGLGVVACNRSRREAVVQLRRLHVATRDMFDPSGVGRARLAASDPRSLRAEALADSELNEICCIDCPKTRGGRLRARYRAELQSGQTELAGGWIVSRTEAIVAALWVVDGDSV